MRISAKELVKQVPKRGGFQPDIERNNGIHFSTPKNKKLGAHYIFLRIGQDLARKAGLAAGDDVNLEWDDETGEGWISPLPAGEGWKLVSGNPRSETPSLVLRMTWRESKDKPMPSITEGDLCKVKTARSRAISFDWPEGTVFGKLATKSKRAVKHVEAKRSAPIIDHRVDELYDKHKEIVEKEERVSKKQGNGTPSRRKSDKAPEWKDGKPYGRRATDH